MRKRVLSRMKVSEMAIQMMAAYVHESTAYEGNILSRAECQRIVDMVDWEKLLDGRHLEELSRVELPDPKDLMPELDRRQVLEVLNLVALCQFTIRSPKTRTSVPSVFEVKLMHKVLMNGILDLPTLGYSEDEFPPKNIWGRPPFRGVYRSTPIQCRGRELTVFPYPGEVPALMEELLDFTNTLHNTLHPLLIAAHLGLTFKHIHPFGDGNGRLGRYLMFDYLVRQGYLPIVFGVNKKEYIDTLAAAQAGPGGGNASVEPWCYLVVGAQEAALNMRSDTPCPAEILHRDVAETGSLSTTYSGSANALLSCPSHQVWSVRRSRIMPTASGNLQTERVPP